MHSHMYTSQLQQQQEKLFKLRNNKKIVAYEKRKQMKRRTENYNKHIKHTKKA